MHTPSRKEFIKGIQEFKNHEKRDAMYKVATFLVNHFWGNFSEMADGLGVLLLTWNQAFYRYGVFNFDELERCIKDNFKEIEQFRNREIQSLLSDDEENIKKLFMKFLDALQISEGKMKGRKSPVSVAKALHILAPSFFPLWDDKIARAYNSYYNTEPAKKYFQFCNTIKSMSCSIGNYINKADKSLIKFIDEYNYSKYTKRWI